MSEQEELMCEEIAELRIENAHLKSLMQDIRNATGNQMERSLLELREKLEAYRWIPVGERLPEYSTVVLVCGSYPPKKPKMKLDQKGVSFAWFVDKCFNNPKDNHGYWASFYHTESTFPSPITHWKPIILPE